MDDRISGGRWLAAAVCLACALGSPVSVAAQDEGRLLGNVVSEARGLPIPGALVALDAGLRIEADADGAFLFEVVRAGPYRIAAVAPGCHVGLGEVEVVAGREVRVRLSVPLPTEAEDRLDAWTLGTRSLGESVRVLTGEQLRRRSARTVQDALRMIVPDMVGAETSQTGGRAVLRNRGAPTVQGNPEPLVILDGVPIAMRSVDALAAVNVEDVELVEVLRGGAGGWRYGMQGANGVVRVTTRDATGGYAAGTAPADCAFTFPR